MSLYFCVCVIPSIKVLPALVFENLNSLETLSIQNNKLTRIPEEVMEPIMDSLRVVDIMGKLCVCVCVVCETLSLSVPLLLPNILQKHRKVN